MYVENGARDGDGMELFGIGLEWPAEFLWDVGIWINR